MSWDHYYRRLLSSFPVSDAPETDAVRRKPDNAHHSSCGSQRIRHELLLAHLGFDEMENVGDMEGCAVWHINGTVYNRSIYMSQGPRREKPYLNRGNSTYNFRAGAYQKYGIKHCGLCEAGGHAIGYMSFPCLSRRE